MTTEITASEYANGQRISTQRVTYNRSDDLQMLTNLYRQYEGISYQIATAPAEADLSYITAELNRVAAEITAQKEIVAGYDA